MSQTPDPLPPRYTEYRQHDLFGDSAGQIEFNQIPAASLDDVMRWRDLPLEVRERVCRLYGAPPPCDIPPERRIR